MFDTHCHLDFAAFDGQVEEVIRRAQLAGVLYITVPGTDISTSKKAVEIAQKHEHVYAAVGIHPHHIFEFKIQNSKFKIELKQIEELLLLEKVVAVGEVGMDRHYYTSTKYKNYKITNDFIHLQKLLFKEQVLLAVKHGKSLIIHNREAKTDLLSVLSEVWDTKLENRTVIHCCEPDPELLEFAKKHRCFIGIDGDITYSKAKQRFIPAVPLDMLVLETDSPFLIPEPLKTQKMFPNEPANISLVAEYVSRLYKIPVNEIVKATTSNAKQLFNLPEDE